MATIGHDKCGLSGMSKHVSTLIKQFRELKSQIFFRQHPH